MEPLAHVQAIRLAALLAQVRSGAAYGCGSASELDRLPPYGRVWSCGRHRMTDRLPRFPAPRSDDLSRRRDIGSTSPGPAATIIGMPRSDVPPTWDERTMLTTFLDYVRECAVAKCDDLSAENAGTAPLPESPLMTMAGIVNHLRWVEFWWFEVMLLGEEDRGPWTDEDPDREFRIAVEFPLAQVIDEYKAQCARVNELIADLDLETPTKRTISTGDPVTLRWVIFHLIEETARHNGHLDVVRELVDGVRGS